jgi:hypothetical protein
MGLKATKSASGEAITHTSLESGLVRSGQVSLNAENPTELLKAGSAAASPERIEGLASLGMAPDRHILQ